MPSAPAPAEENPASTPIGNASHGSQREFFLREIAILGSGNKSDARRRGEQHAEKNHDDRAIRVAAEKAQNVSADQQGREPRPSRAATSSGQ